jgi:hypothetical protein
VVFKEVRRKSKYEVMFQTKNNLEKVRFEPRNTEDDSNESTKLDEEVDDPDL